MKTLKTFVVTLALFGLSVNAAYAENANALKTTIESFAHGGTGALSASVSGNTVTVTGNVTDVTHILILDIDAGVTVLWKAEYEGSNAGGFIILYGSGTFEVAAGGSVIQNGNHIAIAAYDYPITIKVSGGRVQRTTAGSAIDNPYPTGVIEISGGTVQSSGTAIWGGTSTITISGGMILAKEGYAVRNNGGTVTISGGIGFAYGTAVADVINGAFNVPPVNSAVLVAWDKDAGNSTYQAGTSDDIFILPATVTAVWAKQGGVSGIQGTLGAITGFIPVEGVTVEDGAGIAGITNDPFRIYPNPTGDILHFSIETPFEITDLQGKVLLKSDKAVKSVNISGLPSGTYLVTLTAGTGKAVTKIIKE